MKCDFPVGLGSGMGRIAGDFPIRQRRCVLLRGTEPFSPRSADSGGESHCLEIAGEHENLRGAAWPVYCWTACCWTAVSFPTQPAAACGAHTAGAAQGCGSTVMRLGETAQRGARFPGQRGLLPLHSSRGSQRRHAGSVAAAARSFAGGDGEQHLAGKAPAGGGRRGLAEQAAAMGAAALH